MARQRDSARRRRGLPSGAATLRRSSVRCRWGGVRRCRCRWGRIRRSGSGIRGLIAVAGRSGSPRRWRSCATGGLRCCRSRGAFLCRLCGRRGAGRSRFRLDRFRSRGLRLSRRGSGGRRWLRLNRCRNGGRRWFRGSRRRRCRRRGGTLRRCGCRRLMWWGRCRVRRRRRGRRGRWLWCRSCGVRRRSCGLGWCRVRRRCLWRFFRLWLAIRADFVLRLRHNQRRGLRMRRRAYELHCRKSRRSEQRETKFCHDDLSPRKILTTRFGDQRISVRPDCGGLRRRTCFYFWIYKARKQPRSLRIQGIIRTLQWARAGLAVLGPAVRQACGPAIRPVAAVRRDPAKVAALRGVDFPAGSPAAAPTAVRA
jgi:hypothetical protein